MRPEKPGTRQHTRPTCFSKAQYWSGYPSHSPSMLCLQQTGQTDGKTHLKRPKVCIGGSGCADVTSFGQPNDFGGKARHHPAERVSCSCRTDQSTRLRWTYLRRWVRGHPGIPFRLGFRCRSKLWGTTVRDVYSKLTIQRREHGTVISCIVEPKRWARRHEPRA
jgi:hypothetical protein